MNGRSQTGLVCGSSIDDYDNGLVKKHEFTRPEKELDRITHMKTIGAQTGNVFLAYRNVKEIDDLIAACMKEKNPQYSFVAGDGVSHNVWVVNDGDTIEKITSLFKEKYRRLISPMVITAPLPLQKCVRHWAKMPVRPQIYFLQHCFPADQLSIMDYNRVIKDLNGRRENDFLKGIEENFSVEKKPEPFRPAAAHEFGLYMNKQWYKLRANKSILKYDALGVLDINILQDNILTPLLGITDQRTDKRIDFIGGIRGLSELEKRVDSGEMKLAISLYPVSIQQLFAVADSGEVMPPKSTWFEPKLRDGLLTHLIK